LEGECPFPGVQPERKRLYADSTTPDFGGQPLEAKGQ
jgi:hypothetical protein